ncbi:MAG: tyrosine--tRNA ligase, partial [Sphingomonadales bacterium]
RKLFEEGAAGGSLPTLSVPAEGMTIVQANVAIGFAASNKEVKRKIEEGAIRLNDEKISAADFIVKPGDKISFGAKKHGVLTL